MTAVVRESPAELEEASMKSQLEAAHAALSERVVDLEIALQRAEVALTVAQLLGRLVENDGLTYVTVDVVDCWRSLDPDIRARYVERPHETGLQLFAGDYTTVVDRSWHSRCRGDELKDHVIEKLCLLSWQIHIARIRQRQILGEPVDHAWLTQFPVPDECSAA